MLAVAIKFTAIVLLPFLLVARTPAAAPRSGAARRRAGGVPLLALSLALFGFTLPNLAGSELAATAFSFPNLVGLALGIGGATTMLVRLLTLAVVAVVLWATARRNWVTGAGWATVALIASARWLMPWYVSGCCRSRHSHRAGRCAAQRSR